MRRSVEILILNSEGIIKEISYERRAYETVIGGSLSWVISQKNRLKKSYSFWGLITKYDMSDFTCETEEKYCKFHFKY